MKRIVVFGNAGGGKSRLARRLAALTGLPLYVIDKIQFREGGTAVLKDEFLTAHADLLRKDEWIIDGYGSTALAWERFARADTLVYIDLPLADTAGTPQKAAGIMRCRSRRQRARSGLKQLQ